LKFMLEFHPDRANPSSLWGAADAAKKQARAGPVASIPIHHAQKIMIMQKMFLAAAVRLQKARAPFLRWYSV